MIGNKKEFDVLSQLIDLVIRGSVMISFGSLLLLIYLPFSNSINNSFEATTEPIEDNISGNGDGNSENENKVVNGIHVATGMIYDDNFSIVRSACTSCHSAKLVTQNRATRDGWKQMIRWMQTTQGLPDLGKNEVKILDYLAKNYAPTEVGRRKILNQDEVDWYTLQLE